MDEGGMAIAVTSTVNLVFGSQVLDPVTGVLMNDEVCLLSTLSASYILKKILDG